jgi:hypothetical protein
MLRLLCRNQPVDARAHSQIAPRCVRRYLLSFITCEPFEQLHWQQLQVPLGLQHYSSLVPPAQLR